VQASRSARADRERRIRATRPLAAILLAFSCGCIFDLDKPRWTDSTPPQGSDYGIRVERRRIAVPRGGATELEVALTWPPARSATIVARVVRGASAFRIDEGERLHFDRDNWDAPQRVRIACDPAGEPKSGRGLLELVLDGGWETVPIELAAVGEAAEPQPEEHPAAEAEDPAVSSEPPPATAATVVPFENRLVVRECAGTRLEKQPVSVVIPLVPGVHQDTTTLRIRDGSGKAIPAQFEVLNRWWAKDRSIRHVLAHFEADVEARGSSLYEFEESATGPAPAHRSPVRVERTDGACTVDTGVLRFEVRQDGFRLLNRVWLDRDGDGSYADSELIVDNESDDYGGIFTGRLPGDVQKSGTRRDIRIDVEESGPLRAVLRIASEAHYTGPDHHLHGFAVRLYAYAGKSFVKVDYQLQNSTRDKVFGWPLYFEDLSLRLHPRLDSPTVRIAPVAGRSDAAPLGKGRGLFQGSLTEASVRESGSGAVIRTETTEAPQSSAGWLDLADEQRGVFVAIRHMAEAWPNGIEAAADGSLFVRLWPEWSAQWTAGELSPSGLYWLEDMQHVVKETLLCFHGADVPVPELDDLARTFEDHPIVFVDQARYFRTRATFDLSGVMPSATEPLEGATADRIAYRAAQMDPANKDYAFGWRVFGGFSFRHYTAVGGGIPISCAHLAAKPDVAAWRRAELQAMGDLNIRPVWMANYEFKRDFARLRLTDKPYAGKSWRSHEGAPAEGFQDRPHLEGTVWGGWHPWDNQHCWTYHIEEAYYLTGNPWIRDWYEFVAEFRMPDMLDPGYYSTRGSAHVMANALQAYRVTGNAELLDAIKKRFRDVLLAKRNPRYGIVLYQSESAFQEGFVARTCIQLQDEVRGSDPQLEAEIFHRIWGGVDWCHHISRYAYYVDSRQWEAGPQKSSGTATLACDPVAWFAARTGRYEYLDRVLEFIRTGLNGGERAYYIETAWRVRDSYLGRAVEWAQKGRREPNPPAPVRDLEARAVDGAIRLTWTTPVRAARFHVVWSELPIAAEWTADADRRNPWACTPVGNTLAAKPGEKQELPVGGLPGGKTLYFAVLTFNDVEDLSELSNVATVRVP